MFADASARIDRAEGRLVAQMAAEARSNARGGAVILPISGGVSVFAGPRSPMNKVIGLGFDMELDLHALREIEDRWRERDEPVRVELSTLTDPDIAGEALRSRLPAAWLRERARPAAGRSARSGSLSRYLDRSRRGRTTSARGSRSRSIRSPTWMAPAALRTPRCRARSWRVRSRTCWAGWPTAGTWRASTACRSERRRSTSTIGWRCSPGQDAASLPRPRRAEGARPAAPPRCPQCRLRLRRCRHGARHADRRTMSCGVDSSCSTRAPFSSSRSDPGPGPGSGVRIRSTTLVRCGYFSSNRLIRAIVLAKAGARRRIAT